VANRYTVAKDVEVPVEDMSTYMKSKVEEFCEVNNVEEGVIDFSGRISDMSIKEEVKEEPVEKVKPVKKKPVLKKVKKSTPKTTTPKIGREVGSTNNEPMRLVNKYKTTTTITRRGLITVTHSINRNISKVIDGVECVQHTITTTSDSEEPVTNIYMEPVDWKSWSEKSMEERKKFFRMGIKRRNW
jgi:LysM repeat protein